MTDDAALALDTIPTTGPSAWLVAPTASLAVLLFALALAAAGVAWWRWRHPGEFALAVACWRAGISREARAKVLSISRQNGCSHPCAPLLCPSALENAGILDEVTAPPGSRV